jgi:hypothetical protein
MLYDESLQKLPYFNFNLTYLYIYHFKRKRSEYSIYLSKRQTAETMTLNFMNLAKNISIYKQKQKRKLCNWIELLILGVK